MYKSPPSWQYYMSNIYIKYCSFDERFMSLGFKNWTSDLSNDVQDYGGYSPSSCYTTLVALQSLIGNSWYVRIQVEV